MPTEAATADCLLYVMFIITVCHTQFLFELANCCLGKWQCLKSLPLCGMDQPRPTAIGTDLAGQMTWLQHNACTAGSLGISITFIESNF